MSALGNFWKKIESLFTSPKTVKALEDVANVLTEVEPIVREIEALVPNKTVQEITAAYEKYGVTTAQAIENNPTSAGNALLNLATSVAQKNFPNLPVSTIQTAVQMAVTLVKHQ